MEIFYVLTKYVQSRLLKNCRMRERVNPFPPADPFSYYLQQITFEEIEIWPFATMFSSLFNAYTSHFSVSIHLLRCFLTLSHIQQICSRRHWNNLGKNMENLCKWKFRHWNELKTMWQKEKLFVLRNFFVCRQLFSKSINLLQRRQKASICGKGFNL